VTTKYECEGCGALNETLSRYRFDDHEERDDQFGNPFPYVPITSIQ
jgi:hypothetical protein